MDFYSVAKQCAVNVEPTVAAAIVHTESSYNPFAIGVVGGSIRQPRNLTEAILAVRTLKKNGNDFSVGLTQVNQSNFVRYGLNESNMFDLCANMRAGAGIFKNCFDRTSSKYSYDGRLRLAASCYYSGNFKTGFKQDFRGQPPYVTKFYNNLVAYRGKQSQMQPKTSLPVQAPTIPAQVITQPVSTVQQPQNNEYLQIVEAIKAQNKSGEINATGITTVDTLPVQHKWDAFGEF